MADPPAAADRFDYNALHEIVAEVRRKQLFFVGGAPKSGTTWLQLLLNAHPDISCTGEGHFPDRLLPTLARALKEHNATVERKNRSVFEELDGQALFTNRHTFFLAATAMSLMLGHTAKAQTVNIVGDKTPDNVRFFPLLAGLFPRAKFIHIVRDGRDCTASAWFHNMRVDATVLTRQFPTFAAFAEYYVTVWTGSVSHGASFATERPQRCLTIRYEDLSSHPEFILNRICTFLGASRDPALAKACIAATDFARLSGGRERGNEDRDSFFRRGVAGDWQDHFDAPMNDAFRAKAEPWLSRFGYA